MIEQQQTRCEMTKAEFQTVLSDIDRAASEQRIDLSLPENTVTVWLVNE